MDWMEIDENTSREWVDVIEPYIKVMGSRKADVEKCITALGGRVNRAFRLHYTGVYFAIIEVKP